MLRYRLGPAIFIACLFATFTTLPAIASQPDRDGTRARQLKNWVKRFDADRDGDLSEAERVELLTALTRQRGVDVALEAEAVLAKADADSDGKITAKEWSAFLAVAEGTTVSGLQQRTEMLVMSDGVRLATEVLIPTGEGPFPVVFARTPYGRKSQARGAASYARLGYAFVVQDQRGRFDSEGENIPFIGCGWTPHKDGVETLAWIRSQPWCNGRVCTIGGSAGGITQVLLAAAGPEGLTAQHIAVAAFSLYHHACYVGGAFRKSQIEKWLAGNGFDPAALAQMRAHPSYDAYWYKFDASRHVVETTSPGLHMGGWFDTFAQGTVDGFVLRQRDGGEGARDRQKLVMGPWGHGGWRQDKVGQLRFPRNQTPPGYDPLTWLEYHLKGKDNGLTKKPPVAYYVMGDTRDRKAPGNEWRFANEWPIPSTPASFHLHQGGMLSPADPAQIGAIAAYVFDPSDPCPTVGGCNLVLPKGPMNQNRIEERDDVLTFTTEPLDAPVEVTGNAVLELSVQCSAVDTDINVKLCDVYPGGQSFNMAEGMLRLRYHNGFEEPELLSPGQWTDVKVVLWPTSVVFNKGHRIRLIVTSSNTPRFDVNPGTGKPMVEGGETVKQEVKIGLGQDHPSRIVLPVVKE